MNLHLHVQMTTKDTLLLSSLSPCYILFLKAWHPTELSWTGKVILKVFNIWRSPPQIQHACFLPAFPGRNFCREFKSNNSQRQKLNLPHSKKLLGFQEFREHSPSESQMTHCSWDRKWQKNKVGETKGPAFPPLSPRSDLESLRDLSGTQMNASFSSSSSSPIGMSPVSGPKLDVLAGASERRVPEKAFLFVLPLPMCLPWT